MIKLAIFASGSGSNAENIADYFSDKQYVTIKSIVSNKQEAYVHERAKRLGIESVTFSKKQFSETDNVLNYLENKEIDFIILAGFLLKVPENILNKYPDKIINIHPALLPKFGGKGMYGENVHQSVVASGEKESGITIHYVDENYDEGNIIFQATCEVSPSDTPHQVAEKVHALEYRYFPEIIDKVISEQFAPKI